MILNMPVPHVGQVPFMAFRPFAIVFSLGSFISRFALHFTQYASTAMIAGFFVFRRKADRLWMPKVVAGRQRTGLLRIQLSTGAHGRAGHYAGPMTISTCGIPSHRYVPLLAT